MDDKLMAKSDYGIQQTTYIFSLNRFSQTRLRPVHHHHRSVLFSQ